MKRGVGIVLTAVVLLAGIYVSIGMMPRDVEAEVTPNFVRFCEDNILNFNDTDWLYNQGMDRQPGGLYECFTMRVNPYTTADFDFFPDVIPDGQDASALIPRMTYTAEGEQWRTWQTVLLWPLGDISLHGRTFTCYIDGIKCMSVEIGVIAGADFAALEDNLYETLRMYDPWPYYYDYEGYEEELFGPIGGEYGEP
ncbi:MAG: hypothetical protein IJC52_04475 [Clostridia bacterium]|nr:hypothetical protein [Clostridia bacterium]